MPMNKAHIKMLNYCDGCAKLAIGLIRKGIHVTGYYFTCDEYKCAPECIVYKCQKEDKRELEDNDTR